MPRPPRVALLLLGASVALTACPRKRPPEVAPTPTVNQDSINRARAIQDSIDAARRAAEEAAAARERARNDSIARASAERDRLVSEARNALTAVIYFDYDKSDITDASRATLDAKIPVLNANPGVRIRVAGHTDERGSDEYNLALGQRRAAAAKRYLVSRGVDAARIETVSYGEERPVTQGHDESAWSQNRRDEFEITAGGDNLVAAQR
jgi:peptidoglycan-associated lipoprotein